LCSFVGDGAAYDLAERVSHHFVESVKLHISQSGAAGAGEGCVGIGVSGRDEERADGTKEVRDSIHFGTLPDEEELDSGVIESAEGGVQFGDVCSLLGELRPWIGERNPKEFDWVGGRADGGGLSGIGRSSAGRGKR
jgi:hypothetical protein